MSKCQNHSRKEIYTVRLPADVVERVDEISENFAMSRSMLIQLAVEKWLDRYDLDVKQFRGGLNG